MDTETVSPNFDDIRPLNNSEVKDAIEKLVANEDFERALRYIKPNLNWEESVSYTHLRAHETL